MRLSLALLSFVLSIAMLALFFIPIPNDAFGYKGYFGVLFLDGIIMVLSWGCIIASFKQLIPFSLSLALLLIPMSNILGRSGKLPFELVWHYGPIFLVIVISSRIILKKD